MWVSSYALSVQAELCQTPEPVISYRSLSLKAVYSSTVLVWLCCPMKSVIESDVRRLCMCCRASSGNTYCKQNLPEYEFHLICILQIRLTKVLVKEVGKRRWQLGDVIYDALPQADGDQLTRDAWDGATAARVADPGWGLAMTVAAACGGGRGVDWRGRRKHWCPHCVSWCDLHINNTCSIPYKIIKNIFLCTRSNVTRRNQDVLDSKRLRTCVR